MRTVLPGSLLRTLLLAAGAGTLCFAVGTATAWLITMYRFPGRELLDRLLVLPLAVPTYIVAYCYVELLDYAGPLQTGLRAFFGWQGAGDYWFPQVRSLPGAVLIFSAVLYPYVYLTARASFAQQSVCVLEVARTLGRTPIRAFVEVALPLARPAIAAGVALVIMECLNDLGAVQYLGVETLSASIYATWMQRSNLGGAAQIAAVTLLLVVALLAGERRARGGARVHHTTGRYRSIPFHDLEGWKGFAAAALAALPFVLGFRGAASRHSARRGHARRRRHRRRLPVGRRQQPGTRQHRRGGRGRRCADARLCAARRRQRLRHGPRCGSPASATRSRARCWRSAFCIPLAAFDNRIDALLRATFGVSSGLLLSGSLFAITLAYVIRFLAVAHGQIEAGLERISPNLDAAARTLGESALSTLWRVHLPLLVAPLGAAALLVFVDCMKELPATLLLRPFNFETLATHVYGLASIEQLEQAALGSLTIVLVGLGAGAAPAQGDRRRAPGIARALSGLVSRSRSSSELAAASH